ncbi:MAG: ABC-F family ATP-binding cassette domain-containing protein [Micavibrio sp.]|nr:ABC-F family ATP-binding cassette domain-containing protein [Micavibrio sp.]
MPPILSAQSVSKKFGATPLFTDVSLTVSEGDRIGLIGPNGAGKSTLLAVLSGELEPDAGEVSRRKRARVGYVRQISEFATGMSIRAVVERAMTEAQVPAEEREQRLRETLGRAGFEEFEADASTLSGGWRKRLAIVEAVVSAPDVLLLDEPTNHLDLEGIEWLEGLLRSTTIAVVVITHDRYFLENVARDVIELSRVYAEGLLRVKGGYSRFLEERATYMESQARMQESLRNRVRTEIEWLRRGPKARGTKAKARIDTAHAMIDKLSEVDARTRTSNAGISFDATDRQTKRLIELEDVSIVFGEKLVVSHLNAMLANGMKLGLVGPNGSGKTTILRAMTGELPVTSGTVKRAATLRVVYFSQRREIDESLTLKRALAPDSDAVVYQDRVVHVASYAAKFLFTGEQLNQPVERLSGGERARVLLARLMLEPADVLVLDEPTNDLDIPTLEILEEALLEFAGALVLVTHDRYLLDRVANTVLGLDGRGKAALFADYAQWEEWKGSLDEPSQKPVVEKPKSEAAAAPAKKKLSYMEQREFDGIEERIAEAEARLQLAQEQVGNPVIAVDAAALTAALAELDAAQTAHDVLMERWMELTEKMS